MPDTLTAAEAAIAAVSVLLSSAKAVRSNAMAITIMQGDSYPIFLKLAQNDVPLTGTKSENILFELAETAPSVFEELPLFTFRSPPEGAGIGGGTSLSSDEKPAFLNIK